MSFSTRRLFIAIGIASYFFSLAYLTFFQRGFVFLISILAVGMFNRKDARFVVYGSLLGTISVVIITLLVAGLYKEWPFAPHYRTSQRSIMDFARQFAFSIGGGTGALLGFLFSKPDELS